MAHSLEFKSAVVKKALMGGKTRKELADEAGIGRIGNSINGPG